MKFILGKKIEMTQVWQGDKVVAVTKVQAGPCLIVQIKDKARDGYEAVQIGFGKKKEKNIKKPQRGHLNKVKSNIAHLREFRDSVNAEIGDLITVDTFGEGDVVKVTACSKGKGFQGVVKRHGFHGQNKTHGNKDQERMPGSIGSQQQQRVLKGTRMGGRMGGDRVTTSNLEVIGIDPASNIILIKGAVPGARNGLVMIQGKGELKIFKNEEVKIKNEEKVEEAIDEVKVEETAGEVKEAAEGEVVNK